MRIIFEKMQALGNDGIFINKKNLPDSDFNTLIKKKNIRKQICDRNYGVGADILTIYEYKKPADGEKCTVEVWFFNPDGSPAELCLNATRCLGFLLNKRFNLQKFDMLSASNIYPVDASNVEKIKVEIKKSLLTSKKAEISDNYDHNVRLVADKLWPESVERFPFDVIFVSIGNPHLIILAQGEKFDDTRFIEFKEQIGDLFSPPNIYTAMNGANVSFASIINQNRIELDVYERGVGSTLGCGSAACATAFAAFISGLVRPKVTVVQPGGKLNITIEGSDTIIQEGPAHYVFSGEIEI